MSDNSNKQWGAKINKLAEFIKTSTLADGQSIEGTVLGFKPSTKYPEAAPALVMRLANGETKNVTPSGDLKYAVKDGVFEIGKTYKIQKEGTKKIKGMTSGVFGIYPALSNSASSSNSASDDI